MMTRMLMISLLLLLTSCSRFSKEDKEKSGRYNVYLKEQNINRNKSFQYQCIKISSLYDIPIDTATIILKEILENYSILEFSPNSDSIIDIDFSKYKRKDKFHKLDLLNYMINKHGIDKHTTLVILDNLEKEYQIYDLHSTIGYLKEIIDELKNKEE